MKDLEKFFKAVANYRRLKILKHLLSGEKATLEELAQAADLSYRSTSKHLLLLESRGFLSRETLGLKVIYKIAPLRPDDCRLEILKLIKKY